MQKPLGRNEPITYTIFVRCVGDDELEQLIQTINENAYDLVSVTQKNDIYTVFFRRYAP